MGEPRKRMGKNYLKYTDFYNRLFSYNNIYFVIFLKKYIFNLNNIIIAFYAEQQVYVFPAIGFPSHPLVPYLHTPSEK